jgi:enoyl-CoA hydratase/carnithine racemase
LRYPSLTQLAIWLTQNDGLEIALQREADAQAHTYGTSDFREGLAALRARRPPAYGPLEEYSS